jgi:flagellin-like protein
MKDIMRKLRRNAKALSPIFAVLILIAIAVIGGIIIYMFTSGYLGTMMGGGSAGQEKIAIETVIVDATNDKVTAYAKSTGGGDIVITDAILKDASGNTVEVKQLGAANVTLPADGTLKAVVCQFTGGSVDAGYTYTVTLVSQAGNQFVSPSFKG